MPPATYLKAGRASLSLSVWSCFGWGLHGSACYQADGSLLSCLSTLTGKPPHYGSFPGGISLLHWPWSRLHRTLSGILPCEARTFLTHAAVAAIACPAYTFRSYHKPELLATPESFLLYMPIKAEDSETRSPSPYIFQGYPDRLRILPLPGITGWLTEYMHK